MKVAFIRKHNQSVNEATALSFDMTGEMRDDYLLKLGRMEAEILCYDMDEHVIELGEVQL